MQIASSTHTMIDVTVLTTVGTKVICTASDNAILSANAVVEKTRSRDSVFP